MEGVAGVLRRTSWFGRSAGRPLVLVLVAMGCGATWAAQSRASQLPPATLSFHSVPSLHPPEVSFTSDPDRDSGDILLNPLHSYQSGPMILSPSGQLVWFQPVSGWTANLEVQRYQGHQVLTWWQGRTPTSGPEDVIVDSTYRPVAVLHGSQGYAPDLHEFQITPQGTALIDVIGTVSHVNLTAAGGSADGSVSNDVIQEVNIQTGQVLWQWGSLGHVPVTASYPAVPSSGPYDYFHLNSIQELPDGDLLVSARNTSAVYLIKKSTGAITWTLGGRRSNFRMGSGTSFQWQHDAHLAGQTLTLFNDNWGGAGYTRTAPSAGLALHLNTSRMTATLLHSYAHHPSLTTGTQGSVETLPDGDVFVGWGSYPDFSEYTSSGSQIFNGNFAYGVTTYRAYRFPWTGQPSSPPALAVSRSSSGGATLYASWNGATQVARWRVLGGSTASSLKWLARAAKAGFETSINLGTSEPYFAVQAMSASGRVLGTSGAVPEPQP